MIARPLTLQRGAVDLTLHGAYTNWATGGLGGSGRSADGETLAASADVGVTDQVQFGVAVALPVNPGPGFGSALGSVAVSPAPQAAVRVDAGYEQVGFNGEVTRHTDRFFAGVGASIRVPITNTVAFVTGRTGAVEFGHFNNSTGPPGVYPLPPGDKIGLYAGASGLSQRSADFLVVSGGNNNSSTDIGINVPAGLLLQPDPRLAITLLAGYSAQIATGNGSTESDHFFPVGLEAVVSPARALDIGARFFLDGLVARTGGPSTKPGYFDLRALQFWLRFHV